MELPKSNVLDIVAGDHLQIRAGERFPTDAILIDGETTVDEQVFTGESTPVGRVPGDRILGGTVNLDGHVVVEATAAFREGSFGRLLQLLQEARLSRGHYQRLADRVSAWFFPLVTGVALLTLDRALAAGCGCGGSVQSERPADCLPLCAGTGDATGRLDCAQHGRKASGFVSQRRSD